MPLTLIVRGIFLFLKVKNHFKKSITFSKNVIFESKKFYLFYPLFHQN